MRLAGTYIIFFITCLYQSMAWAQATGASLTGYVRDAEGQPIPFAYLSLDTLNKQAVANVEGYYQFKNLPEGNFRLTAQSMGFVPKTTTVTLSADTATELNIYLKESSLTLDEVVIAVDRPKTEAEKVEETGFNVNAIETKKFENTTTDINQVLNQTTGVRIRETGGLGSNFNFYLNGLSGRQVKFFLDGMPLENYGSVFNLNNVPPNLVERVDVYKGVVPIHLGADALGGAINIVTKESTQNYLDASYSIGSFNTHRANLSGLWRDSTSGFTVKPQFFYNYSDNNYTMYNLQTEEDQKFITGDFERFHDTYESWLGNIEAGFTQKSWADQLLFGIGYGAVNKDIQTAPRGSRNIDGSFTIPVVGEAFREEQNTRFTLHYRKSGLLKDKLDVNYFASFNHLTSLNVDTSSNVYNWKGDVIRTQPRGELNFTKTLFRFDQRMFQSNAGLTYNINEHHRIATNFTWTTLERQGENEFDDFFEESYFEEPNTLDKKVLGLSYKLTALKKKLETDVFGKFFHFDVLARKSIAFSNNTFTIEDLRTNQNNIGYGMAGRYTVFRNFKVKASYEKAFRLPEAFEIFGDGLLTVANPELLPEASDNINAGLSHKLYIGDHGSITYEVNGFMRWVRDMIFPSQGGRFIVYENIKDIYIRGLEAEFRYKYKNNLQIGANATYQDVLNNVEIIEGTQIPNIAYRQRMYNTPFFFANADISYGIAGLADNRLKLSVFYNANYVHEFFLNYPNIALGGNKFTVPSQLLHHAGITLSSKENRYNISFQVNNLTNALAYDNFALQKPGRAFFIKLRYFIEQ